MDNYKGYSIDLHRTSDRKYRAESSSGDTYVDDTAEEAIAGVKRKIDSIVFWQEVHKDGQKKEK